MKPIDVKDNTYINIDKEVNNKDPTFKVGDHVPLYCQAFFYLFDYCLLFSEFSILHVFSS